MPHVTSDKLLAYDTALEKLDDDTTYGIYRNIVIQNVTNATEEAVLSDYEENILLIVLFYSIILIISIMLWRIDSNQNPYRGEMILYPVSIVKYFILSMLTFGIYGSYWIYKNFKYIKIQKNESMMPIARGFFDYFWFYPLFSRLVEDSHERFNKNLLPHELIGALLAIVYFLVVFAENLSDYLILALVTSIWVSLPLVIYVNRVNQDNKGAISHNSKWSSRHWLLGFCAIPLIALSMGSTLRVLPANVVIPGNELLSYDLQFMQRKGVIEPGDQINYFYSDAILFIRKDGSGFTKNYVFSYWEDETDGFQLERASYADIKDMEITWAKTSMENTIVKIILSDESYFLLFASSEEKKDKIFVKTLKSLWTAANKSLNQS